MSVHPYESFKEWEQDMDRFREHPQDVHLIRHIRNRVNMSSPDLQQQVHVYLQEMAMVNNPIPIGNLVAKQFNKIFYFRTVEDPWFHV